MASISDTDPQAPVAGPDVLGRRRPDYVAILTSVIVAILIWQGLVYVSGGWVPSVLRIAAAFVENLAEPDTYVAIGITLVRIGIAFLGAFLIGVLLGVAMGLWTWVDAFWRPIIALALAIPDPVYFIMAVLVLGSGESISIFALTLAVLPFAVSAVAASVRARDGKLDEMARTYRFSSGMYARHLLIPQIAPAILVSARTAFAFSWKIGVLMEAMTRSTGIGAEIFYAFRLFRPHDTIALALIFILVMRAVEMLLFAPIERRSSAWRR